MGQTLIDWTYAPAIAAGNATNHLMVIRSGKTIELFANGTMLSQFSDDTVGAGFIGLASSSFADNVDTRFDNFSVIGSAPRGRSRP